MMGDTCIMCLFQTDWKAEMMFMMESGSIHPLESDVTDCEPR